MSISRKRSELDKYDIAILSALATDTRLTTVEIATIVHLSRTAVSRRITTLKQTRVLNNAARILNYEFLGFAVRAIVEVNAPSQTAESLRQSLLTRPEILSIATIAGDGLLCLDVITIDMEHLHHFVSSLQRSGNTSTKIVFAEDESQLTLVERMRLLEKRSKNTS